MVKEKNDIIDLSNYDHSIRFLINKQILESTSEINDYFNNRKQHDVDLISGELEIFSSYLMNVFTLSKTRNEFYSYRQKLIRRKQLILDDQAYMVKESSLSRSSSVTDYKTSNNPDQIRPSNDFERKALLEGKLAGFQSCLDNLDNHIGFLMDSIKNISDMIYGFQFVIELEQYRKNS